MFYVCLSVLLGWKIFFPLGVADVVRSSNSAVYAGKISDKIGGSLRTMYGDEKF